MAQMSRSVAERPTAGTVGTVRVDALSLGAMLGLIGWLAADFYGYSEGAAGSIGVAMALLSAITGWIFWRRVCDVFGAAI